MSELAQVFSRFGAAVTVVESAGRLLPAEEPEAGALLAKVFGREGIGVRTGSTAERVAYQAGPGDRAGFTVTLGDGTKVTGSTAAGGHRTAR